MFNSRRVLTVGVAACVFAAAPGWPQSGSGAQAQGTTFIEVDAGNGCRIRSVQSNQPNQYVWNGPCKAGYADGSGVLVSKSPNGVLVQNGAYREGYREGGWEYYARLLNGQKIATFRMQFNRGISPTSGPAPGSSREVPPSELPAWAQVLARGDFATAAMRPDSARVASPAVAAAPPSSSAPQNQAQGGQDARLSVTEQYLRGCGKASIGEICRGAPPCINKLLEYIDMRLDHERRTGRAPGGGCRSDASMSAFIEHLPSSTRGSSAASPSASSRSNSSQPQRASGQDGSGSSQESAGRTSNRQAEDLSHCIVSHRGQSREQQSQRGVYEHLVYLRSGCGVTVNVRVCYSGTSTCTMPAVSPGEERMTTLGIKRGVPKFQYEFSVQRAPGG